MTRPPVIRRPSPNFGVRAPGKEIYLLILHYTGMESAGAALERLCDPTSGVSAHYLIDEDGICTQLVDEAGRAHHAGLSSWEGETDINSCSIGIELVNPGHATPGYAGGYRAFPDAQMDCLTGLMGDICGRRNIRPRHVLGHSDIAPGRKIDPGERFDWPRLAKEGLALTPTEGRVVSTDFTARDVQEKLRDFGYGVEVTGEYDAQTKTIIGAFQRHFRPENFDGIMDAGTYAILEGLAIKNFK